MGMAVERKDGRGEVMSNRFLAAITAGLVVFLAAIVLSAHPRGASLLISSITNQDGLAHILLCAWATAEGWALYRRRPFRPFMLLTMGLAMLTLLSLLPYLLNRLTAPSQLWEGPSAPNPIASWLLPEGMFLASLVALLVPALWLGAFLRWRQSPPTAVGSVAGPLAALIPPFLNQPPGRAFPAGAAKPIPETLQHLHSNAIPGTVQVFPPPAILVVLSGVAVLNGFLYLAVSWIGWQGWRQSRDPLLGRLTLVALLPTVQALLGLAISGLLLFPLGFGARLGHPASVPLAMPPAIELSFPYVQSALGTLFPVAAALILRGARRRTGTAASV
jgi:hypothetical protein